MNIRELDRLVSKTEMTPTTKLLLRHVRKAVVNGRSGEAMVGEFSWTVAVDAETPVRFSFRMRRSK